MFFYSTIFAVPFQGGKGLIYVHSANVLNKGYLDASGGVRYFGKIASFGGQRKAYTLWNVKGTVSINYGLSENVELAFTPIINQDTNKGKEEFNIPDDLRVKCLIIEK